MTLSVANVGGTLTGGSTVNLAFAGIVNAQKASFVAPTHTRLAGRQVDVLSTPAVTTAKEPGVARGGLKITFSDRQTEEGCCTVQQGSVIIDVGVRWSLNQPEALVDDAIEYLQALVFNAAFTDAVKKGILPA
jgi:hypothetical protein